MTTTTELGPLTQLSPFDADEGNLIGRDPRTIPVEDWEAADMHYLIGMKAIRAKCLDCCCDSTAEVRKCVCTTCSLWHLRMGSVPKGIRALADHQNGDDRADLAEGRGCDGGRPMDDAGAAENGSTVAKT